MMEHYVKTQSSTLTIADLKKITATFFFNFFASQYYSWLNKIPAEVSSSELDLGTLKNMQP